MDSVKMLNEDIIPLDESKQFNVTQHKKELFGMFTGQEEDVRFVIDKSLLDVVFDRFGCDIKVKSCGEDKYTFTAQVQVSPIFIGWCCAFGKKVKIVSPDNVVEKLKSHLKEMGEQYE